MAALLAMTVWIAWSGRFRADAGGSAFSLLHALDSDLVRVSDAVSNNEFDSGKITVAYFREQLVSMVSHHEHVCDDDADVGKRFRVLLRGPKENGRSIPRGGLAYRHSTAAASTRHGNRGSKTANRKIVGTRVVQRVIQLPCCGPSSSLCGVSAGAGASVSG